MNRKEYLIFIAINSLLCELSEEEIEEILPEQYEIYKKIEEEIKKKGGENEELWGSYTIIKRR